MTLEPDLLAVDDASFWRAWCGLSPEETAALPPEMRERARVRFHRLREQRERARLRETESDAR